MKVPFLEYRSALAYNRDVFSIEHGDLLKAFVAIDGNFPALVELPRTHRDQNGKAHVSLVPMLLLLQRQAHTAFDALSADQSYQAWLLLRPGIEAALIIGKWVDNPQNAKIWQNRDRDPGAYQKVYTGKALQSAALPGSDRIQGVLRSINDRFAKHGVISMGSGLAMPYPWPNNPVELTAHSVRFFWLLPAFSSVGRSSPGALGTRVPLATISNEL